MPSSPSSPATASWLFWPTLLFYLLLAWTMYYTAGFHSVLALPLTLAFLIVCALLMHPRWRVAPVRVRHLDTALGVSLALSLVLLALEPRLNVGEPLVFARVQLLLTAALVLAGVLVALTLRGVVDTLWFAVATAIGMLLLMAALAVSTVSPSPHIDVFINNTRAVDFFRAGSNPYSQVYGDIYGGAYDYLPGFLYFPGTLLWLTPFRMWFWDIRYGLVFANALSAAGFFLLAARRQTTAATPWLYALCWLSFPIVLFVLDNAWTDTVLVTMSVLGLLALDRNRWWVAAACGGFAFAFKQHGFVIPLMFAAHVWAQHGTRSAILFTTIAAAVFAAVVAPFAVWDFSNLYRYTIENQLAPGMRTDALNFTVYLHNVWQVTMSKSTGAVITCVGVLAGTAVAGRRRAGIEAPAAGLFIAYGVAFLFGKWAFANYYFFIAALTLLCVVTAVGDPRRQRPVLGPGSA